VIQNHDSRAGSRSPIRQIAFAELATFTQHESE
jgi:hypothetical protein